MSSIWKILMQEHNRHLGIITKIYLHFKQITQPPVTTPTKNSLFQLNAHSI